MSFDFVKCVNKWSSCIRRRVITEEEFAYKFFNEVGECAPSEEGCCPFLRPCPKRRWLNSFEC